MFHPNSGMAEGEKNWGSNKGKKISKAIYGILNSPKKQTKNQKKIDITLL